MSGLFTDTVTIYNKISDSEWKRTVVKGVQWSDKTEKKNENGKISIALYLEVDRLSTVHHTPGGGIICQQILIKDLEMGKVL